MSGKEMHITHLWPELLNANGSQGNVLCLKRRLEWRGFSAGVEEVPLGDEPDWAGTDLVYIGGGTLPEQSGLWEETERLRAGFADYVAHGGAVLAVCEGFELLGRRVVLADGTEKAGFGLGSFVTEYGSNRLTGPVVFEYRGQNAAAFENHAGRIHLDRAEDAAGKMLQGYGNDDVSDAVGYRKGNVFGFPLCGPLLPRNAFLADDILASLPGAPSLEPLDDALEEMARQVIVKRWEK